MEFVIIAILLVFCTTGQAGIRKTEAPIAKLKKLKILKKDLGRQENEIGRLNVKIHSLENTLGTKSRKYLEIVKSRREIEKLLEDGAQHLASNEQRLKERFFRTQKILKAVVLERLKDDSGPSDIIAHKVLMKNLSTRIRNLKENIGYNSLLQKQIKKLKERYDEYLQVEKELANFLHDLEEEKISVKKKYYSRVKRKSETKRKYHRLKGTIKKKSKKVFSGPAINYKFSPPVVSAKKIGLKNKGKGLFLTFKGVNPVKATADGRIVFSGNLSTYGKLVMIDHGEEIRSVILGQFISTAKKGKKVKRGEILGYTDGKLGKHGKVYFEVRKGNKIQYTLGLMEKDFYSKNNLANNRGH
ncbi:MAG: peptidoglycan DD-metalloendopeptidase family protein [Bacteriovoracaceae bacterium]|nr:peptidoglycan DD-metalloendopeptidase family protein [Bacteriovoracaceae bacterium]